MRGTKHTRLESSTSAAALILGTRVADVTGNPNATMATGRPWRVVACQECGAATWTSATARIAVAAAGLRAVDLCEPCAGLL